ncbi:Methyltransferase domain-containing protein [Ruminococcus flavefaciens]|uniref:Methyltransferase domain-containing protein n=1 Tax=Ruminococcus flavefaciens TaxID=1265 RepID=A0A1H6I8E6_RUMFL|nr:class I SAM-dependent methyltransferase [Ruminococcus flavefaciens]SEH42655.1 Methyltransferase domain-containing protein [Ruminococcus flavefaciens]
MTAENELKRTFDSVSSAYDKMRPGYVGELYQKIFGYVHIDKNSRAVEVGSGSGQATKPVLDTGCDLTAVEYGENLSELLRENFKGYPNLTVMTGKFEDMTFSENTYDLVFSATAFHWIPEETGYRKVFSMLRQGGAFARFANHPCISKKDNALAQAIEDVYDKYYYSYYPEKKRGTAAEYTAEQSEKTANISGKYGFTDIQFHLFYRERVFTADEYIQLLGTYSDHIAIEKGVREEFFSSIKEAVNAHGGRLVISDTLDLQLARKL